MYCPNCSAEASTEQKFCRSCGMELHSVATLIRDQSPLVKPESPHGATFEARQRAALFWGLILMLGAVAVGASLKILGKENIHPAGEFTPYLSVIAVVVAILGMGLICYPLLQQTWGSPRSRRQTSTQIDPTTKLRPALLAEEQPSVTDRTTELFEASEVKVRDTAPQDE